MTANKNKDWWQQQKKQHSEVKKKRERKPGEKLKHETKHSFHTHTHTSMLVEYFYCDLGMATGNEVTTTTTIAAAATTTTIIIIILK